MDAELFAGRDAGGSFVRCGAAEAGGLRMGFVGSEGDQVEAERSGERGLKLVDLGVEFEEEAGFALRVEIAGSNFLAKIEGLAIDRRESLSDWQVRSCRGTSTQVDSKSDVDLAQAVREAIRALALSPGGPGRRCWCRC